MTLPRFEALFVALASERVDYVLVGGVAAVVHGAARATYDVDIVYARTAENMDRLVRALAALQPYLRGAPPGLPFSWDVDTLRRGLNFTLTTTAGDIDLLGEVTYGHGFEDLAADSEVVTVFGVECRCLSLGRLITLKRAAGRPKDLAALAELEALAEERR
jgi:predicted nucleotidyltransferase